jgi:hypothetical protein
MQQTTGGSLGALYQELPEELQGMVELAYDSHNNPSLRLFSGELSLFTSASDLEYRPARLPNPETEIACASRSMMRAWIGSFSRKPGRSLKELTNRDLATPGFFATPASSA